MNIYNIFPEEIWIQIIQNLPCKTLTKLYDVSEQFYHLDRKKSLYEYCKYKGFPRQSGYTKTHNVSKYKGSIYNYQNELIYQGNLRQFLINN